MKKHSELINLVESCEKILKEANRFMIFRHKKTGNQYRAVRVVINEKDLKPLVMYLQLQAATGAVIFVRPFDEFLERFEGVKEPGT